MKNIVILGAGTAGTMAANLLTKQPALADWRITVIDKNDAHLYQPGFLFIPFGTIPARRATRSRRRFLPKGVDYVQEDAVKIDLGNRVILLKSGREIHWDQLLITTGTVIRPDLVTGMKDGELWHQRVFDFYTLEGATQLKTKLREFERGRLLVHISEMPIKCPVAPLEFILLVQDYLRRRGRAWQTDIALVTPLDGAFTKPVASKILGNTLAKRGIDVITDFEVESIDNDRAELVSYDGRQLPFDLLVTIPPNRGVEVVAESGLADDAGFVEVDKHTLQSVRDPDVWAAGDATNVPTSKAGSVAHFEMDALVPNIVAHIEGRPLPEAFDGHANCFVESGRGEALLLDFNYDQEPLPGMLPIFKVPMLKLLGTSMLNHAAKLGFEALYWLMLLPGRRLPIPSQMSMAGKVVPSEAK